MITIQLDSFRNMSTLGKIKCRLLKVVWKRLVKSESNFISNKYELMGENTKRKKLLSLSEREKCDEASLETPKRPKL